MKICSSTLFIAFIFILADVIFIFNTYDSSIKSDFYNNLDVGKQQIYKSIIQERTMIYMKSVFVALMSALSYMYLIPRGNFFKPKNMSKFSIVALSIVLFYVVSYQMYILYPKTDYMMLHLDSENEKLAWLKVYRNMQYNFHLSFVLGFIGVCILFIGIC